MGGFGLSQPPTIPQQLITLNDLQGLDAFAAFEEDPIVRPPPPPACALLGTTLWASKIDQLYALHGIQTPRTTWPSSWPPANGPTQYTPTSILNNQATVSALIADNTWSIVDLLQDFVDNHLPGLELYLDPRQKESREFVVQFLLWSFLCPTEAVIYYDLFCCMGLHHRGITLLHELAVWAFLFGMNVVDFRGQKYRVHKYVRRGFSTLDLFGVVSRFGKRRMPHAYDTVIYQHRASPPPAGKKKKSLLKPRIDGAGLNSLLLLMTLAAYTLHLTSLLPSTAFNWPDAGEAEYVAQQAGPDPTFNAVCFDGGDFVESSYQRPDIYTTVIDAVRDEAYNIITCQIETGTLADLSPTDVLHQVITSAADNKFLLPEGRAGGAEAFTAAQLNTVLLNLAHAMLEDTPDVWHAPSMPPPRGSTPPSSDGAGPSSAGPSGSR
ncbi:hypothetical protein HYH03_013463 [Edaphochlamys debaryana]|uniref:Uncharacterized protein n=1 Tax=Edaphochlamys debaryana TaxID=47281 RepID=A0A835XTD5_9CHLO|nr:hypothetical protein HYH03_013463 [Edaphochlamys debaryana]|eukprot:KAG2487881.1 hypothetical protein HYH03_013463 [Edaphochlamys debaryana]